MKKLTALLFVAIAFAACQKDVVITPECQKQRDSTIKTDPYDRGRLPIITDKVWGKR